MSLEDLLARTRELEALLAVRERTLAEQAAKIAELSLTVDEQKSLISQLQRMLFGPTSEKMTQEQATQLATVVGDLTEQEQRPGADSDTVLAEDDAQEGAEKEKQTSPPIAGENFTTPPCKAIVRPSGLLAGSASFTGLKMRCGKAPQKSARRCARPRRHPCGRK